MDDLNVTVIVLIDNVWHYIKPSTFAISETPEGTKYEIKGTELDGWKDIGESA